MEKLIFSCFTADHFPNNNRMLRINLVLMIIRAQLHGFLVLDYDQLRLMTNYDMLVTNGRVCGDLSGNYTCCQRKGSSVVDMFIAQKQIFSMINYFKVGKFDWFSDHTPVTVSLAVSLLDKKAVRLNWQSVTKVFKNWDVTNRSHLKDLLYNDTYQARLDELTKTNFRGSETAATAFTNILQDIIYKVNVVANTNLDHLPDLLIMNVKSPSVCGKRQNDLSIRTQIA